MDNLPLVHHAISAIYKKWKHQYSYEDLFQVGCIGLIEATEKFKDGKNAKFSTFAYRCIQQKIFNYIRDDGWYLGKRDTRGINKSPLSLDTPLYVTDNNNVVTMLDALTDNNNEFEKMELKILIDDLPKILKEVIYYRYFDDMTLCEVAKKTNLSKNTVARREKRALRILRYALKE